MGFLTGKGWADRLAREPTDDNWSYGFGLVVILAMLFASIIFIISLVTLPNYNPRDLLALGLSAGILSIILIISTFESFFENASIGFAFFGNKFMFIIQILSGIFIMIFLMSYLSFVYCNEQTYIQEGYCIKDSVGHQQFILPTQASIVKAELAEPFYSILYAPITEELFFRGFMFYTIIALAVRFRFLKNLKENHPIILFALATVISNTLFAVIHYYATKGSCPFGEAQCIVDRIYVSNLYGTVWVLGNQILGGIGFSIAGHIMNNFVSETSYYANILHKTFPSVDFILYIIIPLIFLWIVASGIYGFFSRGKRK